ncbi:MAG: hypothetical protein KAT28_04125 [Candidatus Aenigmarchaeota archaeon]|nr:hypothetical protein [Candidatus Aenigmarchaeota archaeon]
MGEEADLIRKMTLFGDPEIGYLTNPETGKRPNYIEINGEKVVCLAKGGECRFNPDYYNIGINDAKSWKTPIIDETCPNRCGYKRLVCDDHPEGGCSDTFYPHNNKFRGQFTRYCRNFSLIEDAKIPEETNDPIATNWDNSESQGNNYQ